MVKKIIEKYNEIIWTLYKNPFSQTYFSEFWQGSDNLVLKEIYATTPSYIVASIIASLNLIHIDKRIDIL